jgi:hypothetical protein
MCDVLALQKLQYWKASSQGYVSSIRLALWQTLDPPVGEVKAKQGESNNLKRLCNVIKY